MQSAYRLSIIGRTSSRQVAAMEEAPHVRALVVDDSETAQEAVFALMELEPLIELVGRANDGVEAIEAVANLNPDLVIMAVDMPYLDGLQTSLILARYYPDVLIALMSSHDNPKIREQADGTERMPSSPNRNWSKGCTGCLLSSFPASFSSPQRPRNRPPFPAHR